MYNLYSFKIKELLFGPIRFTSVHFGLLPSTVVPFGPLRFTSVHCGNFLAPYALFRPRAYKNRAYGAKKFPQWISRLRVSRSTGELFFPQMLCLGRELTKTEHLGPKNFLNRSRDLESRDPLGKFFFPRCSV